MNIKAYFRAIYTSKFKVFPVAGMIILLSLSVYAQFDYPYDFSYNGNPLVRNHGAADPDVHVWDDTIWLYCSQDHAPGYEAMDGYHAFSSTDMIHWTDHGEVLHSRDITWGPSGWMWAPGAALKDGTYYLYYPHKDNSGQWRIGIATSDVPEGPFTDIGAPMEGIGGIDPAIFIDDDGQAYIYNNSAIVAKLKPNMIELAESPRHINYDVSNKITDNYLEGFAEGSYMHKRDGIYYYSYSNWHNDQYQAFYAIGDNPYGPFEWKGPMAPNPQGAQDHHSVIEFQNQWYYFYHIAVGSYPSLRDGQSRIACYDRLYYNNDGSIQLLIHTYGPTRLLTVEDHPSGRITFDPPGRSYPQGTQVSLTANGELGYKFESWGGDLSGSENPISLLMDSDKNVSVNYVPIPTYELSTNSSNGMIVLDPPGGIYNEGTVVSVEALSDFGYEFSHWSGDLSGSENPALLTMDSDKNIRSNYEPWTGPTLVFATNCGGNTFKSSEGITYSADMNYSGGGTYSSNNSVSGTDDDVLYQSERNGNFSYNISLPNGQYDVVLMFAEVFWSEAGKRTFNIDIEGVEVSSKLDIWEKVGKNTPYEETHRIDLKDGMLNIVFSKVVDNSKISAIKVLIPMTNFDLLTSAVNGSISLDPPGGNYDSASLVSLSAIPDEGYRFIEWSGDLSGTNNPASLILDSDKHITALFEEIPSYALTTNISNGTITLDPAGGSYQEATVVTLTVTPDEGYEFLGWSGDLTGSANPATLYMDEDKAVTAITYGTSQFVLTVNAENGSVALDPEGGSYDSGTSVSLTATANEGYEFAGWNGDLTGSVNPETLTMDGDKSISAIFTEMTGFNDALNRTPGENSLGQNVPNPFHSETTIPYHLSKASNVEITVYNYIGQQEAILVNDHQVAGNYRIVWRPGENPGIKLSDGLYIIRMKTDNEPVLVKKSNLMH